MNDKRQTEVRAALYARVSSVGQAEKDLSIPAQLKALRQHADKHGWRVVEQFVDEAESARTADRPQFQRMVALAKQKPSPFQGILVWKLSRFARNREDSILYKSMLRKHGVQVVSINEPIDDSAAGRMLEGMIEVVDEFYSANLSSDTIRGLNENASRGFRNGSVAPYGYRIAKVKVGAAEKSKLEVEPLHAPVVRRIFKLCLNGMGVKEIAKKLNAEGVRTRSGSEWTNTGVYYLLTNEAYAGVLVFNRYLYWKPSDGKGRKVIRVEGAHPPLVTPAEFAKVRAILAARAPNMTHPRQVASDYLLAGVAYCGACGAKLLGTQAKGGRFFYYGCRRYLKQGSTACRSGLINRAALEEAVLDTLRQEVLTDENLAALAAQVNREAEKASRSSRVRTLEVEAQARTLQARLNRLYEALETGHVDLADVGPRIKALRGQIEALESRKAAIEAEEKSAPRFTPAEVKRQAADLRRLLEGGTLMERKAWLRTWLKRVEVDKSREGFLEFLAPFTRKREGRPTVGGLSCAVLSMEQNGSPSPTLLKTGTAYRMSFRSASPRRGRARRRCCCAMRPMRVAVPARRSLVPLPFRFAFGGPWSAVAGWTVFPA